MTLYNIRLKGTPNDSGITTPPTSSVVTPPINSNIKPTTNANYTQSKDFKIRETQHQEPWCTEYVAASAINTISHAGTTPVTSAKDIMKLDRPGIPDEELVQLPGTTIARILQVIKEKYNTTVDVENKTLSFAEVKKEIDAGGTVSIDGYNSESKDAPGTGENLGHQVSIVGYVTPTSGTQTPYYVVWNPWWDTTFYLSANAKTFNLGGVKYKWLRTWHNWKTTSPASRSLQSVDPEVGKQKVASTANPMALKDDTKLSLNVATPDLFTNNLQDFSNKEDILSQNVSQYGAPVMWRGSFNAYYGYQSTIPKKGQRRVMKTFSHNTLESTLYFDTNEAEIWRNDISQLNNYQSSLRHSGITLSIEVPLLLVTGAAVGAGLSEAATMSKVTGWLSFFGTGAGIMGDDNPISVTRTLISYYKMDQKMIHDGERCYFAEGPV